MANKSKKLKKKEFFEVSAPITATKIKLYASSQEDLIGKIIKLDLTRNLRGKNLIIGLKVRKEESKLVAEPESIILLTPYIRKMIRKGSDYVEDSFEVKCKDSDAIIKPFMITRNKVSRTVRKIIRETAKKYLETHLKTRSSKEIFTEMIANKLQKELSLKIKKVYPLALCEIKAFKLIEKKD